MTKTDEALHRRVLTAIGRAWAKGAPLSMRPRDGDRFIARALSRGKINVALAVERHMFAALKTREIEEVAIGKKPPAFGLRLAEVDAEVLRKFRGTSARKSQPVDSATKIRLRKLMRKSCGSAEVASQPIEDIAERKCGGSSRRLTASSGAARRRRRRAPPAKLNGKPIVRPVNIKVGDVVNDNGQIFRCVAVRPHECGDGSVVGIALWQAACADCGEWFHFTNPVTRWRSPNRRCDAHKSPLKRSRFTRRDAP